MSDVFLVDPRHEPFVNGDSPYLNDHALSWLKRLTIVALIAVSLMLGASLILPDDVAQTSGRVTEKTEDTSDPFDLRYWLTVAYAVGGRDYSTIEQVDWDLFNVVIVGSEVTIRYEVDHPLAAEILPLEEEIISLNTTLFMLIALVLVFLWVIFFWLVRPNRLNQQLETAGEFIEGTLIKCYPVNQSQRNKRQYEINAEFLFEAPTGEEKRGIVRQVRNDLKGKSLPNPGTKILVRYVDERLYRLM